MEKGTLLLVAAGVLIGVAAGIGGYTFVYAQGRLVPDQRPGRLRELPRHARAVRRLAASRATAPSRPATTATRRTGSSASTSTKAPNGFWHSFDFTTGRLPRADPDHAAQPRDHRGGLPHAATPTIVAGDRTARTGPAQAHCPASAATADVGHPLRLDDDWRPHDPKRPRPDAVLVAAVVGGAGCRRR